jgi:hypothetical protein
VLEHGETFTRELYSRIADEESMAIPGAERSRGILDQLVLTPDPAAFLTLLAYGFLNGPAS